MTTDSGRKSRLQEIPAAVDLVKDGMTVAIGGFINSNHPMAIIRELIRQGKKDLVVVGAASAGLELDLMIAAGCVRQVVTPYVGAEGLAGIGPAFRAAAQAGEIDVYELDEALHYAALRASAQRLPFNPWRAGIGTSLPEVNPDLKVFTDPIDGQMLIAVPARQIDVCFVHANGSDEYGNVQHLGTRYGDVALAAASDMVVASVERIIPNEAVRANPAATSIAGADVVVRAQFGAHPFSADGHYATDRAHLELYLAAAVAWQRSKSDDLKRYLDKYVYGAADHVEYLEQIGFRALLGLHEY
jgi:glutaconate CoA-transferase, subunit A